MTLAICGRPVQHGRMRIFLPMILLATAVSTQAFEFTEVGAARGAARTHGFPTGFRYGPEMMAGGAAGGDIDADGDIDLIVLRGAQLNAGPSPSLLPPSVLINDGLGQFSDGTGASGLSATHLNPELQIHNGAYLVDLDGDDDLDLLLGALKAPPEIWRNDGAAHFTRDSSTGLDVIDRDTWGASFANMTVPTGDSTLEMLLSHWTMDINQVSAARGHFWEMDVPGHYVDFSNVACCSEMATVRDHSFTASFAALDNDGVPDLFWARDFGTSGLFGGLGDGGFSGPGGGNGVPSDENGMGTAVGDFDNDGRPEWFVTSIFDPTPASPEDPDGNWGRTGNRLYRIGNDGWEDASISAGVRDGGWGWGACARDFDLDGDLDLFHVNGFFGAEATEFHADAARLFINDGAMHFSQQATQRGIADTGQGRAVVCADIDRDGDIDVFIQNSGSDTLGTSKLYLNDAAASARGISIALQQTGMNRDAVGVRVYLRRSDGLTQMRELEAGGSFLGTHPIEAHFGLGDENVTAIRVQWPDAASWPQTQTEYFRPATTPELRLIRGSGFDLFIDAFE